jgi:hypothetical protein
VGRFLVPYPRHSAAAWRDSVVLSPTLPNPIILGRKRFIQLLHEPGGSVWRDELLMGTSSLGDLVIGHELDGNVLYVLLCSNNLVMKNGPMAS